MAQNRKLIAEYDYIVVGAGSSGCALAARLAEGSGSVAVLEAGRRRWPRITAVPAAVVHTIGHPWYDWRYTSEPDPSRVGRTEMWPRGKGPGGSGLINGTIFVRGAPADFDAWRDCGATGWSYEEVLPFFRRMESVEDADGLIRGGEGPQAVEMLRYVHPLTKQFVESAVRAGVAFNPDYNGREQDGVSYVQAIQHRGRRHSPMDAYLTPALRARKIDLIDGALAHKVVFEGRTAVGVEFECGGLRRLIRARRLVVLTAGAINSPQLLMLSGIGPADQLREHGLPVIADIGAVGANLMEHVGVWMRAEVKQPTLNQERRGLRSILNAAKWVVGRGPATSPTAQALAFLRTAAGLQESDVQIHYAAFGRDGPGRALSRRRLVSVVPTVSHPQSRGEIRLRSASARDAPLIYPRLLESAADMKTMRRGIEQTWRIIHEAPFADQVVEYLSPPPLKSSGEEFDAYIRAAALPIYHPVGTCRMGSDAGSVVGPDLRVRGVEGLAIADVSIMPRHISGNTHAAALMIGEKAADLLGRRK